MWSNSFLIGLQIIKMRKSFSYFPSPLKLITIAQTINIKKAENDQQNHFPGNAQIMKN